MWANISIPLKYYSKAIESKIPFKLALKYNNVIIISLSKANIKSIIALSIEYAIIAFIYKPILLQS